tara:strand:- start:47 stop:451 length:405 start_codon:yes stop_codon:yes gene_type:complete
MTDSIIDHFKCEVRRFDSIDYEIKELNEKMKPIQQRLKELRSTKKELEGTICSFMQSNEIAECKLSDGALLYKESKNVIPLSKNGIKENIIKFFRENNNNDEFKKLSVEQKAETLFKFVYENREYKQNNTLKRV